MLNPDLKLNTKLFDKEIEEKPTRDGFGEALVELGDKDQNVVVLSADLTESTRCEEFAKRFPERFFECGVAEQNMAAIAAGLGVNGKIPFISSYATFSPGKNWETIRTTIIYNESNVKIAGHHSGIVTGPDGATHQATEDIATVRCWPGIKVVVPCDSFEAKKATLAAGQTQGPFYLRFTRDKTPVITTDQTPFSVGKMQTFWVSENPEIVIFASGHLLYFALMAAKKLEEGNVQALVVNAATIKPLDEEVILETAKKTGAVVTVEDHQVTGGLGGAIAEFLGKNLPTPIEFIGLQDTFAESGAPKDLIEKYGLGADAICKAALKAISRKKTTESKTPSESLPIHTTSDLIQSVSAHNIAEDLKAIIKGEVDTSEETLTAFSHDTSLFELKPKAVVYPKDSRDIESLVKFVALHKKESPELSLTGRSGGTDMSGGAINDSIIVSFKNFNHTPTFHSDTITVEPGVYYRDFEKETLKHDLILPTYPASREICALGGMINNNSGGEKSLEYGKTEDYVEELSAVLSDGNEYLFKPLSESALKEKAEQKDFEGEIYRKMYKLISDNYEALQKAKPNVSKNSAGYFLWNVYDKDKGIFDLTKLFVGAQGTLGLITSAKVKLVPVKKFSQMMIMFLPDIKNLGEIIKAVLPLKPESFETYDDHTLKLALKFFPSFAEKMGAKNTLSLAWQFLPEASLLLSGFPKLVLQAEFSSDDRGEINDKIAKLRQALSSFEIRLRIAPSKKAERKYWLIRRESFNLLRQKIKDKHTAPFIDDFIVRPEYLTEFLPKLDAIFKRYPDLTYTIAGHMGDGNFHIIPLMKIEDPKQREIIPVLGKEVYDLVLEYKGSITAEHNDGLIRTPYLKQMYGQEIYDLFEETKKIFDPENIFNPRKKVGGDLNFALDHIRKSW